MLGLVALPAAGPAQSTEPSADLSVAKSDSADPVMSGAALTYTIEVRNEGPDPATSVTMTDDFPAGVEFILATPSTGTCERKGGKVTCAFPTLANDEVATVTIDVIVTKKKGQITNSASVQSAVADPQAANNLDTEATQIAAPPPGPTCKGRDSTIVGTEADDAITGTDKKDVIVTLGGNDAVFALSGTTPCAVGRATTRSGARSAPTCCAAAETTTWSAEVRRTTTSEAASGVTGWGAGSAWTL